MRRAMAIQLIINKEFGLAVCENATQGSFIVEELTDLVEEAVLAEFDRITERGGVLGAMELQYQRGQIQDDSLQYETPEALGRAADRRRQHLPAAQRGEAGRSRARRAALARLAARRRRAASRASSSSTRAHAERRARGAARGSRRRRASAATSSPRCMDAVGCCSLGQITHALYEVGGEYRRNL